MCINLKAIEAELSLPIPKTRSINGFPIKRKSIKPSASMSKAIDDLRSKGASFLYIRRSVITVRINGHIQDISLPD
jgi:hypothetical protein